MRTLEDSLTFLPIIKDTILKVLNNDYFDEGPTIYKLKLKIHNFPGRKTASFYIVEKV